MEFIQFMDGKLIHLLQDSSILIFEIDTLFLKFSFQSFDKNLPHRLLGFVESIGLLEFVGLRVNALTSD